MSGMNGAWWAKDRRLDAAIVRQVVRSQFADIEAATVRCIGEGWDFEVYEIDGRWIFRFPKRRDCQVRHLKELALLDDIAGDLPLAVPTYEFRGRPSDAFPYHFSGHVKLPGEPGGGADLSVSGWARVAEQLGELLDCLHRLGQRRAAALDTSGPEEDGRIAQIRRWALGNVRKLCGRVAPSLLDRCREFFADESRLPGEYDGPARLVHADFLAEHILIGRQDGRVTGVIDWSDAAVGDPAGDLAGLWVWRGDAFVAAAVDRYHLPMDRGIWDRMRYHGMWIALGDLYYGHVRGGQTYIDHGLRCLQREFGGG